jgi:predicted transcriptional regulator
MTTLTITLPDDRLAKLQEIAARLQVTPDELATTSIEELLTRPDEVLQQALHYVFNKNADLYRRLG